MLLKHWRYVPSVIHALRILRKHGLGAYSDPVTDQQEPTDFNHRVGWNLRRFRNDAGLSQADLATALAVRGFPFQQPTVLKVERGSRPLKLDEAYAIAEVLGIDPANLTRHGSKVTAAQGAVLAAQHNYSELLARVTAHQVDGEALSKALRHAGEQLREANKRLAALTGTDTKGDDYGQS